MKEGLRKLLDGFSGHKAMLSSAFQGVLYLTTQFGVSPLFTETQLRDVDQHTASTLRPPCLVQYDTSTIQNPAYDTICRANSVFKRAAKPGLHATLNFAS